MPFTPYHFGPSGFLGLVFRKYIDIPVFLLSNIIVDLEVLYFDRYPIHRYLHTLLIGGAIGAVWGLSAYPLRGIFKRLMGLSKLPYRTSLLKMTLSGILGVWLHVLIDGIYHFDVKPLWPNKKISLWHFAANHIGYRQMEELKGHIETGCIVFAAAAIIFYFYIILAGKSSSEVTASGSKR